MTDEEIREYLEKFSEKYDIIYGDNIIIAIRELLDKLQKEIEETAKRQMIATTNYWKDKIRNKIKELEEDKKGYEEEGFENMKFATEITIIALEELLGDEEND